MILVIRIAGQVDRPYDLEEAFARLRLLKKYSATLIADTPENRKQLQVVRNFVAFGTISKESLVTLLEKRGQMKDTSKKLDAEKAAGTVMSKGLAEAGLKPFFRLHPPRGGIESKKHVGMGKGVLGDHKENITKLMERML